MWGPLALGPAGSDPMSAAGLGAGLGGDREAHEDAGSPSIRTEAMHLVHPLEIERTKNKR